MSILPNSRYRRRPTSIPNRCFTSSGPGSHPAPEIVLACVVVPVVTECFDAPAMGEAYSLMFGFTHPQSRGSLRLANADPAVPPLIDPNYLAERLRPVGLP